MNFPFLLGWENFLVPRLLVAVQLECMRQIFVMRWAVDASLPLKAQT